MHPPRTIFLGKFYADETVAEAVAETVAEPRAETDPQTIAESDGETKAAPATNAGPDTGPTLEPKAGIRVSGDSPVPEFGPSGLL